MPLIITKQGLKSKCGQNKKNRNTEKANVEAYTPFEVAEIDTTKKKRTFLTITLNE